MKIKTITAAQPAPTIPQVKAPLTSNIGLAAGFGSFSDEISTAGNIYGEIERRKKEYEDSVSLTKLTNDAKIELAAHYDLISLSPYETIADQRRTRRLRFKSTTR